MSTSAMSTAEMPAAAKREPDGDAGGVTDGASPAGMSATARPSVRVDPPGPPLHAALDYCTRRLLAALDAFGNGSSHAGSPLAAQLTPASDRLLRWWFSTDTCRARVDNFHFAQRESILHTIIAHELLRSDDPVQLHLCACGPQPTVNAPWARDSRYRLRLAPGGGARWVLQALLVWWWANAVASADDEGSAAGARLQLIAATPGIRQRLLQAIFGRADGRHADEHCADASSLLRHARLFLPPALRGPFRDWLRMQSPHDDAAPERGALRIVEAANGATEGPVLSLIATCGPHALGAGASQSGARLRVELMLGGDHADAIVDAPQERMIRRGAAKLPMLEATATTRLPSLRFKRPRHCGLRPRLSRSHPALLRAGIDALRRREPGFASLDAARRPRMLVLCDTPSLLPAARRFLIVNGFAPDTIAIGGDRACGDDVRAIVDRLPARSTLADARICVVVTLRTHRDGIDPLAVVAAGAAPLWPEPDFADVRNENRERATHRRAPQNLIDVLSVIEHPQCHAAYALLLRAGLCAHGAHAVRRARDRHDVVGRAAIDDPAIDDLIVVALQARAAAFDIALPLACVEGLPLAERLSDLSHRVLRMRHALPVRKSVYTHDGCSINDSGLWRAFLGCAESDPEIESHGLIDPKRHGPIGREAWLAQGFATRVWPEAVIRTADRVYLVNFQPFCPTRPRPPDSAERQLARWLRRANALPASQRQGRIWCRATLAAPLFWSWKRSEGRLSALLSELADAVAPTSSDDIIV